MKKKVNLSHPMIEDLAEVVELMTDLLNCEGMQIKSICYPASLCRIARHFNTTPWDLLVARLAMRESKKTKRTNKRKK